ncbi:MAG: putative esterase [Haloarculaceae archaeon]|jgi:predicted esterase
MRTAPTRTSQVVLVGFSQGACLASEFVARSPQRVGGLAALSGGLVGERIAHDGIADSVTSLVTRFSLSARPDA